MNKRNNNVKLLLLLSVISITVAVATLAIQLPVVNATLSGNVVANVIVSNTCYISVTPALSQLYSANVYPGINYNTNQPFTDTDNGGNIAANVYVAGTGGVNALIGYWFLNGNTLSSTYFGVSNTAYSTISQSSWTGNLLSNTLTDSHGLITAPNTLNPSTSNILYFGLSVPSGQGAGIYTQNVEFENKCSGQNQLQTISINAVVGGVCYISLAPNAITFGTLLPAASYNTNQVIVDSDSGGNAQATIFIQGISGSGGTLGYWIGQSSASDLIPVGNTLWSSSSQGSYTGTALTNSLATTSISISAPNSMVPTTSANVYLGLGVPGGTAGDTYVQNVLLENSC